MNKKGFTLIEILLVIGIIAVLATVVIVALDPAKRFADARDARRLSDIQSILDATEQYIVDNKGSLPSGLDTTERQLGTDSGNCDLGSATCSVFNDSTGCLDLSAALGRYLKSIPTDPALGTAAQTRYSIVVDAHNIVTVRACDSEDPSISSVSQ